MKLSVRSCARAHIFFEKSRIFFSLFCQGKMVFVCTKWWRHGHYKSASSSQVLRYLAK